MQALDSQLELWGGIECTVNRVGDSYLDQVKRSGHEYRVDDLDRFAELGIKRLRYPILWERVAPNSPAQYDWRWSDERMARLKELKIKPIVGLVHHGSGPRYTNLLDPDFPSKLAAYARAVAERYPWVDAYTPVNEPLTTARFGGLYGFWYPHHRNDRSFLLMLIHQLRAISLAMREIRAVNPAALLIQTDDLGKVFSTPLLRYQAEFENERRWLSYDVLCGRKLSEPMREYLDRFQITDAFIRCADDPTPPNICGFNYYLTSERFLDERVELYPRVSAGGNGVHRYVDVEAVRVLSRGVDGAGALLREAWNRFGLPLAITEIHNGCTREEQMRWLVEVWNDCRRLRSERVDVRATTCWSLLGAYDWNTLVTRQTGFYEPGAFDLRAREPRPTAIARLLPILAAGQQPEHPVLDANGWWHRDDRFSHGHAYENVNARNSVHVLRKRHGTRPLLITGRTGTLGQAFAQICIERGLTHELTSRQNLDITDPAGIATALRALRPWALINTAGYVRVDDAETDQARCFRENTLGPTLLAEACAREKIPLVTFSSDLVFDGHAAKPYTEDSLPNPRSVYGRSKRLAEQAVMGIHPSALVIRTSAFFGPWDEYNFVTLLLRSLRRNEPFATLSDCKISPTYVPDLVHATLDLLLDEESGILHLANAGVVSWFEFGRMAASASGLSPHLLVPILARDSGAVAPRPAMSALDSKLQIMPTLGSALHRYLETYRRDSAPIEPAEPIAA